MLSKFLVFVFEQGPLMSKRTKHSRDSGSSTKRSRSKGPSGGVKAMDYAYIAPRAPPRHGPEKKSVDTSNATWDLDSTGTITLLGAVAPGAGRWERVGRKVNYRSIHIKGVIRSAVQGAASIANSMNRLVLVYDRQPNKVLPAISDILADVDSAGATTTTAMSGLNLNNSQRFLILRDSRMNLPGGNGDIYSAPSNLQADGSGCIDWFVKLKDLPCEYAGDTAAIGSIASGALYLLSLSDEIAASRQYVFRGCSRTRYVDY